jgi:hypothetical protein
MICKNCAQSLVLLNNEGGIKQEEPTSLISNYRQTGFEAKRKKFVAVAYFPETQHLQPTDSTDCFLFISRG